MERFGIFSTSPRAHEELKNRTLPRPNQHSAEEGPRSGSQRCEDLDPGPPQAFRGGTHARIVFPHIFAPAPHRFCRMTSFAAKSVPTALQSVGENPTHLTAPLRCVLWTNGERQRRPGANQVVHSTRNLVCRHISPTNRCAAANCRTAGAI